jgi:hypothetical protein
MSDRIQQSIASSNSNKQTPVKKTSTGIVVDLILDDTHPRVKNKLEADTTYSEKNLFHIGSAIIRPFSDKSSPPELLVPYQPINQYEIDLPIIGEVVELLNISGINYYRRIPGNTLNKGKAAPGRSNNIYIDTDSSTKQDNYNTSSQTGTPLGNTSVIETNDVSKLGKYFVNTPVNKLKLYEGDKLVQSRFGQSIRFSGYNNSSNVFSPTLIIRNRQDSQTASSLKERDITEENITQDGSIIVLSSGEYQIPFTATTSITPNKFSSYPSPLKGDDHLLINSGKIIISAKTGQMLFHSKGDYGFISDGKFAIDGGLGADLDFGGDVNITTNRSNSNVLIGTGTGRLFLNTNSSGKSPNTGNSSEPLVRGNTLKQILETMVDLITSQVYRTPSGPTAVGPENRAQFNGLKRQLAEMLSTLNYTE